MLILIQFDYMIINLTELLAQLLYNILYNIWVKLVPAWYHEWNVSIWLNSTHNFKIEHAGVLLKIRDVLRLSSEKFISQSNIKLLRNSKRKKKIFFDSLLIINWNVISKNWNDINERYAKKFTQFTILSFEPQLLCYIKMSKNILL